MKLEVRTWTAKLDVGNFDTFGLFIPIAGKWYYVSSSTGTGPTKAAL